MRQQRDARLAAARLKALTAKGLHPPHELTPDETRELCGLVSSRIARREG